MERRWPMVSCTRAFMCSMASLRATSRTPASDSSNSRFACSSRSFVRAMVLLRRSSSVTSMAVRRRYVLPLTSAVSRLNRRTLPSPTWMRTPSGSTSFMGAAPRFAISHRFSHSMLTSDRSVAKPSSMRHHRMASFMYSTRPLFSAMARPSGRRSTASMAESCVMLLRNRRMSRINPALTRNVRNAASAMNRYGAKVPAASMTGGEHRANNTISQVITGLRYRIASARPMTAKARLNQSSALRGSAVTRRCSSRVPWLAYADSMVAVARYRCTTNSAS